MRAAALIPDAGRSNEMVDASSRLADGGTAYDAGTIEFGSCQPLTVDVACTDGGCNAVCDDGGTCQQTSVPWCEGL